jgi:hypothetical protein
MEVITVKAIAPMPAQGSDIEFNNVITKKIGRKDGSD